MKTFYSYIRDTRNRPIITRCIVKGDNGFAFGQAFCSRRDNPCKKIGKQIAYGRALKALAWGRCRSAFGRAGKLTFFKAFNQADKSISRLMDYELRWIEKEKHCG